MQESYPFETDRLNAGWQPQAAEEHFHGFAPMFEIGNEIDFVL
jgi:carbonic anhydrase